MRTALRILVIVVAAVAVIAVMVGVELYLTSIPPPQILLLPAGTTVGPEGQYVTFTISASGDFHRFYGLWYADLGGNVSVFPQDQPCTVCQQAPPSCGRVPWNGIADIVLAPARYTLHLQPVHELVVVSEFRLLTASDPGLAGGVLYTPCLTLR